MDGVLANFVDGLFTAHGRHDLRHDDVDCWRAPYAMLGNGTPIGEEEFWAPIVKRGRGFWRSLEPYPWAYALFEMCRRHGDVVICTTPSYSDPDSLAGKVDWLNDHFGNGFFDYMLGPHKHLMAPYPGAVLVDDRTRNCQDFSGAGGRAIVFPQPWNVTPATIGHLRTGSLRLDYVAARLRDYQENENRGNDRV